MMSSIRVVDFSRSSCGWLLSEQESYGTFAIDSILTVHTAKADEVFVLSSQVPAGNVYGDNALFKEPPYGFSIALGATGYRIFRDAWRGPSLDDESGVVAARFKSTTVSIQTVATKEVREEDLFVWPDKVVPGLSAKVCIPPKSGEDAMTLEFPVRHINVNTNSRRYQVETTPVLTLASGLGGILARLRRASAIFNSANSLELMFDSDRPSKRGGLTGRATLTCSISLARTRI